MFVGMQLENFKAFGDAEYLAIRPITLLLGKNSCGKSSCIRALQLLHQTMLEARSPAEVVLSGPRARVDFGSFEEMVFNHRRDELVKIAVDDEMPRKTPGQGSRKRLELHISEHQHDSGGRIASLKTLVGRPGDSMFFPVVSWQTFDDDREEELEGAVEQESLGGEIADRDKRATQSEISLDERVDEVLELVAEEVSCSTRAVMDDLLRSDDIEEDGRWFLAFLNKRIAMSPDDYMEHTEIRLCQHGNHHRDRGETPLGKSELDELREWLQSCREQLDGPAVKGLAQETIAGALKQSQSGPRFGLGQGFESVLGMRWGGSHVQSLIEHFIDERAIPAILRTDDSLNKNDTETMLRKLICEIIVGSLRGRLLDVGVMPRSAYHFLRWLRSVPALRPTPRRFDPLSSDLEDLRNSAGRISRELQRFGIAGRYEIHPAEVRGRTVAFERRIIPANSSEHELGESLVDVGFGVSQILPVLEACIENSGMICIEQPELHLHPAAQSELADFFAERVLRRWGPRSRLAPGVTKSQSLENESRGEEVPCKAKESGRVLVIETHSEHLVLRLRQLVREGKLEPDDISLNVIEPGPEGSTITRVELGSDGRMLSAWPGGFFPERQDLL